jgi:uncharacterized repeat protein (TIGR03803 family)
LGRGAPYLIRDRDGAFATVYTRRIRARWASAITRSRVFKITPSGTLSTLHSFTGGTDGESPFDGLIQGSDRSFYGTAFGGGAKGAGTVFKISPSGTLKTLYSFCTDALCADGESPYGGLVQGSERNFYGTTSSGANGYGKVFEVGASLPRPTPTATPTPNVETHPCNAEAIDPEGGAERGPQVSPFKIRT